MGKHIKKLHHEYHYRDKNISADMEIDLGRFEGQYSKAQFALDSMVMTSMVPFMPMQTGQFINVTKAMSASIAGSGKVVAAAPPFGRFLYGGKLMVDEITGSAYARKGARKVLASEFGGADVELDFYKGRHPNAQKEWFKEAKEKDEDNWKSTTKRIAGGNK